MTEVVHGAISLSAAALCLEDDCETVFHYVERRCPACASEKWALLAVWLPTAMASEPDGR